MEADRPESFGEIKGLVGFEDGGFAVLESQSLEIRVFAADGSHLATHGQRGEGPGEFIGANGLMLDPSGRIWVWSATVGDPSHRVHKWMPGGDTLLVAETQRPPFPVSGTERDSVIAEVRAWFREQGAETEADWSRIPDVKPSVLDLVTSAEGNLWVRTSSPGGGITYDVLAPDGAYLGSTAPVPLATVFWLSPVIRGDYYWTVVFDELDVPYVVRAKITPVE